MTPVYIRIATMDDLPQLQVVGRQTFYETFAAGNTEENIRQYLEDGFSVAKLTAELMDPNSSFYLAFDNETAIGYLKINTGSAQTEFQEGKAIEIERIYVLKAFHGHLVGQQLYRKAMAIAAEKGAEYVWLGVWEENPRAIAFYKKNGFVEFDKHIFMLGNMLIGNFASNDFYMAQW